MKKQARMSMALWILLAIIVFNVKFDWRTRVAGHEFVAAQLERVRLGQQPLTINDGFRPMVRQAAIDSSVWLVLIAAAGSGVTLLASRRTGE